MRRGFTLVEMLVATALVMLIMLLFADVFGAAVGTMTAQRGIANNDQKARSFTTVLRHDLAGRTYRASQQRGATRRDCSWHPGISAGLSRCLLGTSSIRGSLDTCTFQKTTSMTTPTTSRSSPPGGRIDDGDCSFPVLRTSGNLAGPPTG
ncbi:MAG: type II secretion system protein [Planctomycetaceae bacterium]